MADFGIIEADFQQFYNLDVSTLGFQRYARLLSQLPPESRMAQKYSPFKDWNWDREMQSQILRELNVIATNFVNANRKKGARRLKFQDQLQPDYVVKAKKALLQKHKEQAEEQSKELAEFFSQKNSNILEDKNGA